MESKIVVITLCVVLSGCFGRDTLPPSPFPNSADLQPCDYPMRTSDSDAALSDAYLRSLGEIEKCNERLKGVSSAKQRYQELIED